MLPSIGQVLTLEDSVLKIHSFHCYSGPYQFPGNIHLLLPNCSIPLRAQAACTESYLCHTLAGSPRAKSFASPCFCVLFCKLGDNDGTYLRVSVNSGQVTTSNTLRTVSGVYSSNSYLSRKGKQRGVAACARQLGAPVCTTSPVSLQSEDGLEKADLGKVCCCLCR